MMTSHSCFFLKKSLWRVHMFVEFFPPWHSEILRYIILLWLSLPSSEWIISVWKTHFKFFFLRLLSYYFFLLPLLSVSFSLSEISITHIFDLMDLLSRFYLSHWYCAVFHYFPMSSGRVHWADLIRPVFCSHSEFQ